MTANSLVYKPYISQNGLQISRAVKPQTDYTQLINPSTDAAIKDYKGSATMINSGDKKSVHETKAEKTVSELWIYRGIVSILLLTVGYFLSDFKQGVDKGIEDLKSITSKHGEELAFLKADVANIKSSNNRIDENTSRLVQKMDELISVSKSRK